MKRILVIGIGSLIMTDDGIGTRVADTIKGTLQEHGIPVLIGETDVQYCLDEIRQDDFLVIIDSMAQGRPPGSIEIISLLDAVKSHGKLHAQHDYSLIDAAMLNYPEIQGCLIGVEVAEIGFGFELSKELRERFDTICEGVIRAVVERKEAGKRA